METRQTLLGRIKAHLASTGMSARDFSLKVNGDHKWLSRLEAGKVNLANIERAEALLRGEEIGPPKRRRQLRDVAA